MSEETSADLPVGVEAGAGSPHSQDKISSIPKGLCQSFCSAQDLLLPPGFLFFPDQWCIHTKKRAKTTVEPSLSHLFAQISPPLSTE